MRDSNEAGYKSHGSQETEDQCGNLRARPGLEPRSFLTSRTQKAENAVRVEAWVVCYGNAEGFFLAKRLTSLEVASLELYLRFLPSLGLFPQEEDRSLVLNRARIYSNRQRQTCHGRSEQAKGQLFFAIVFKDAHEDDVTMISRGAWASGRRVGTFGPLVRNA